MSQPAAPTFVIAGAAKAGTTALYQWLTQHPEIYMSPSKEPQFFAKLQPTFSGPGDGAMNATIVTDWSDYLRLFEGGRDLGVRGEASTSYLFHAAVAAPYIRQKLPDCRVIILLRNPIDRAFSAYSHLIRDKREPLSFDEGLKMENDRQSQGWEPLWAYGRAGLYAGQVKAFLEVFPQDQVGVWLYDDLSGQPMTVCDQVCDFLGVGRSTVPFTRENPGGVPKNLALHRFLRSDTLFRQAARRLLPYGAYRGVGTFLLSANLQKPAMPTSVRRHLQEYFAEDVRSLDRLVPHLGVTRWIEGS